MNFFKEGIYKIQFSDLFLIRPRMVYFKLNVHWEVIRIYANSYLYKHNIYDHISNTIYNILAMMTY